MLLGLSKNFVTLSSYDLMILELYITAIIII